MKSYLIKTFGFALTVILIFIGLIIFIMLFEKTISTNSKETDKNNIVGVLKITDSDKLQEVVVYEAEINGKKYLYTNQNSGITLIPLCSCQE